MFRMMFIEDSNRMVDMLLSVWLSIFWFWSSFCSFAAESVLLDDVPEWLEAMPDAPGDCGRCRTGRSESAQALRRPVLCSSEASAHAARNPAHRSGSVATCCFCA